jgi:hypothetical protein
VGYPGKDGVAELVSLLINTATYGGNEVDLGVGADFLTEAGGGYGSIDGDLNVGLEAVAVEQAAGDAGAFGFEVFHDLPDGGSRNLESGPAAAQGA